MSVLAAMFFLARSRRAKRTAPLATPPHTRPPKESALLIPRRVRVPRQDLNLKEVPEPSSNRKPMHYMIAMLCARPRLAPHAPARTTPITSSNETFSPACRPHGD